VCVSDMHRGKGFEPERHQTQDALHLPVQRVVYDVAKASDPLHLRPPTQSPQIRHPELPKATTSGVQSQADNTQPEHGRGIVDQSPTPLPLPSLPRLPQM
jgi:hypothetical protein